VCICWSRIDYELLLQFALRAIGCRAADVRFGVLPPQSCLRRNDERGKAESPRLSSVAVEEIDARALAPVFADTLRPSRVCGKEKNMTQKNVRSGTSKP